MTESEKLCDCVVCGKPVPRRAYQATTARTCTPGCAKTLATREHPDIKNSESYWRKRFPTGDPEAS
jgi:hypothetical protein